MAQLQPDSVFPGSPIDFRTITVDAVAFTDNVHSSFNFGLCRCPSSVTCGATPCDNDLACGGGNLCVDGFCADPCGRCTQ